MQRNISVQTKKMLGEIMSKDIFVNILVNIIAGFLTALAIAVNPVLATTIFGATLVYHVTKKNEKAGFTAYIIGMYIYLILKLLLMKLA